MDVLNNSSCQTNYQKLGKVLNSPPLDVKMQNVDYEDLRRGYDEAKVKGRQWNN